MENKFKGIRTTFFSLIVGPILLLLFFILTINKDEKAINIGLDEFLVYFIPIIGIISIFLGYFLYLKKLKSIKKEQNEDILLQKYLKLTVIRFGLIQFIALFSVIAFKETLNNTYILYTFISLAFFIPIFPSYKRFQKETSRIIDNYSENSLQPPKNINKGRTIATVIITVCLLIYNFVPVKEIFTNIFESTIHVDNGKIINNIYKNNSLGWEFQIPEGYNNIPLSILERNESVGSKMFDSESDNSDKPIRLLNITNGNCEFTSNLSRRKDFPNLHSETECLNLFDEKLKNFHMEGINITKKSDGFIKIDKINFKFAEYNIHSSGNDIGMIVFSKFFKDFTLDMGITYKDSNEFSNLFNNFKLSKFSGANLN